MVSITTNLQSLLVQNNMKQATSVLDRTLERMSTGYKINHAKDNAACYSIANTMDAKLSSYYVAQENAEIGMSYLNTAEENLSLINAHLQRVRALAEQAANGTYSTPSRDAIQAEIDNRLAEINRILAVAEYNGTKIFDDGAVGTFAMRRTSQSPTLLAATPSTLALPRSVTVDETKRVSKVSSFTDGETYYLTDANDLVALQNLVNAGNIASHVNFRLANDIDMAGISFSGIGTIVSNEFYGRFYGQGYTISNLESDAGLFGRCKQGTISNLILKDCSVTGSWPYAGTLAGEVDSVTISDITVINTSVKGNNAGGLVGYTAFSQISNCSVSGVVNATGRWAGGLVGRSFYLEKKIINCTSSATVSGRYDGTGGLIGCLDDFKGTIENCSSSGAVSGYTSVGGLIGFLEDTSGVIKGCSSTGNVTANQSSGGFIGEINEGSSSNSLSIIDSYSKGVVTGSSLIGAFLGELIGKSGMSTTVTGCKYNGLDNSSVDAVGSTNINIDHWDLTPFDADPPEVTNAVSNVDPATGFTSGETYYVNNAEDLKALELLVQSGISTDGIEFVQTGSIDMSGESFRGIGATDPFEGTYDGGGFAIENLVINAPSENNVGLFAQGENATIKNIKLENCDITGADNTDGICGNQINTTITNCTVNGNVTSTTAGGGATPDPDPDPGTGGGAGGGAGGGGTVTIPEGSLGLFVGIEGNQNSIITTDTRFGITLTVDVSTAQNAIDSLADIDNVIKDVGIKIGEIGATYNRLESVLDMITTNVHSLTASLSTIKDADIAKESTEFIKHQILQNACATLLATANQTPSVALSLL